MQVCEVPVPFCNPLTPHLCACVPLQAKHFRLYTQEVLELGHNVSFLLLLPASDDVCTAPGQTNPYTLHSGFLNLPLQMFELGRLATVSATILAQWPYKNPQIPICSPGSQWAANKSQARHWLLPVLQATWRGTPVKRMANC